MTAPCRIGVLAQSVQDIGEITRLIRGAGYVVLTTVEVLGDTVPNLPDADVWVVNLDLEKDNALAIVELLDNQNKHVIFDDDLRTNNTQDAGEKPLLPAQLRQKRERRLAEKLRQWVVPVAHCERKRATDVWVLAASTGGPEAVISFLKAIPKDLKGVAFIYAQHIEGSAVDNLSKVVAQNCPWEVCTVNRTHSVREQTIYVVSPQQQFDLQDTGTLAPLPIPWAGKFSPSLNQVIAKVARVYGSHGGAIVFSGMGDDGANSCNLLRYRGGQVWTQTPETCAVDSMPESVKALCPVHYTAPPELLAQQFIKYQKYGTSPS